MSPIWRRKPWRSGHGPFVPFVHAQFPVDPYTCARDPELLPRWRAYPIYLFNQVRNVVSWLRYAHDCQDPRIGCSCAGSYRFPAV